MKKTILKRKRENKTDYRKRIMLLKSRKLRLVIKRSLNNLYAQIIQYDQDGDKIIASSSSNQLKKYGWKFHRGNIPSAYLTGLLCASKAKERGVKEAIVDIGLYKEIKGNALYAVVKGAIDGGLKIACSEEAFPSEDRLYGKHIKGDIQKTVQEIKEKILKQNG